LETILFSGGLILSDEEDSREEGLSVNPGIPTKINGVRAIAEVIPNFKKCNLNNLRAIA
jgi:hypothetical protein